MKTKLLKKARKRFAIIHYPNGYTLDGTLFDVDVVVLTDEEDAGYRTRYVQINPIEGDRPFCDRSATSVEEATDMLKKMLINRLREENKHMGSKRNKLKKTKLWYNP